MTMTEIFEYLKSKYNFIPEKVSIDFIKSEYIALTTVFKNICILPCFFHFTTNIVKKLPDLKSKNKNKKS